MRCVLLSTPDGGIRNTTASGGGTVWPDRIRQVQSCCGYQHQRPAACG
jgi:hypothetical protein